MQGTKFGAVGAIGDGSQPFPLFLGYCWDVGVMMAGGLIAWFLAVDVGGKSLEDVTARWPPLTSTDPEVPYVQRVLLSPTHREAACYRVHHTRIGAGV